MRILRVARFAARFADFSVAPETLALMREMVEAGEVDALVAERVWQELARGLMEDQPSRMFEVLRECGALARLLPEVDRLWGVPQRADYHPEVDTGVHLMMVLDMSARLQAPLPVRFACLTHDLGKGTTPAEILPRHIGHEERSARLLRKVCERLRVPDRLPRAGRRGGARARQHPPQRRIRRRRAGAPAGALRRLSQARSASTQALLACECDARGRLGLEEKPYPQRHAAAGGAGGGAGAWPRMRSPREAQQQQHRRPQDRRDDPPGARAGGRRTSQRRARQLDGDSDASSASAA